MKRRDHDYLLIRFASAGSTFSDNSFSPSTSSSSECSRDDPLAVGFDGIPVFFWMEGKEGIPIGPLESLSCDLDESDPAPT